MAWKQIKQRSLADALQATHKHLEELDDVDGLIDWSELESLFVDIHAKRKGQQAWPPLMMFKALLLQAWYKLSDPALEKQLVRDLLFRRFVGISLDQSVPDHSTLWRFRNLLEQQGLWQSSLDVVNEQLSSQGYLIKTGEASIIDASVIEAKNARPNKNTKGDNTQDPEAGYNIKTASDGKRKTTYGYKIHANVDEDGFIKKTEFTAGNVHDSQLFKPLLTGNEQAVYADSAYRSVEHDKLLARLGVANNITQRAYRNRPLSAAQKAFNRRHRGTRSIVERVFGVLKLHYGMSKARYLGKCRNQARVGMMSIAYNLKRAAAIRREYLELRGMIPC